MMGETWQQETESSHPNPGTEGSKDELETGQALICQSPFQQRFSPPARLHLLNATHTTPPARSHVSKCASLYNAFPIWTRTGPI